MATTGGHALVDVGNGAPLPLPPPPVDQETGSQLADESAPDPGNDFLLPSPLAHLVSFGTRSTSHVVRITGATVQWGLSVFGGTTLSAIQLARIIIDEGLFRASKDAIALRHPRTAEADARANVDETIGKIHDGIDHVRFWALAGVNVTSSAVSKFFGMSLHLLSTLDNFFGSTDSSRAMASIITVIRRELGSPAAAGQGETVSFVQLIVAFCVLAHLQRSCRELLEDESRRYGVDEVLLDVLALDWEAPVGAAEEDLDRSSARRLMAAGDTPGTQRHFGVETTMHVHLQRVSTSGPQALAMPLLSTSSLLLDSTVEDARAGESSQEAGATFPGTPPRRERDVPAQGGSSNKKSGLRGVLKKSIPSLQKDHQTSRTAFRKMKHVLVAVLATRAPGNGEDQTLRPTTPTQEEPLLIPKESMVVIPHVKPQEHGMDFTHTASTANAHSIHETRRRPAAEACSVVTADRYRPAPTSDETTSSQTVNKNNSETRLVHPRDLSSRGRQRASIYTLAAATDSESCLISYHAYHQQTQLNVDGELSADRRSGTLPGMFPERHFLANLARYMRFASASYGSMMLGMMGLATRMPTPEQFDDTPQELRSFAHHTRSKPSDILLSSFFDAKGGSDGRGATNGGMPLVHYISLDHESKAVVLACRGTLDFEDVLADMACEYDDLVWRGKTYKVHKGVHASAKRLLYGRDGRVLHILKAALEGHPDYGLVLTGHSLGAAVTSLLGIMLSEPRRGTRTRFVTSYEPITNPFSQRADITCPPPEQIRLPPGRPIHVYAYGPPSTVCPHLRAATRGLITTVVHGNDIVPYLSLGMFRDAQGAALAIKSDFAASTTGSIHWRIWDAVASCLFGPSGSRKTGNEILPTADQEWAFATLKVLRVNMMHAKLVPPGEIFVVESMPVPSRRAEGFGTNTPGALEHRVVLKHVRDVERRFGEMRFGSGMFADHMVGNYERALERLRVGARVRG